MLPCFVQNKDEQHNAEKKGSMEGAEGKQHFIYELQRLRKKNASITDLSTFFLLFMLLSFPHVYDY